MSIRTPVKNHGFFWQITDMHIPTPNGRVNESSPHFELIRQSLKFMASECSDPDFIAWTGDTISHSACQPGTPGPLPIINWTTHEIRRHFPSAGVFPVLGNHDDCPPNQWPIEDYNFYKTFMERAGWNELFSPESRADFVKGGFYSAQVSQSLQVVVVNSVHWIYPNKNNVHEMDPCGQLRWLRKTLRKAKKTGTRVLLLTHVPPGHEPNVTRKYNVPRFNGEFVQILGDYEDVVMGVISGHLHHDALIIDSQVFRRVVYSAPPLSRINGHPGVRLYTYDRGSGEIVGYRQYYLTRDGWILFSQESVYSFSGNSAAEFRAAVEAHICCYYELFSFSDTTKAECGVMCKMSIYCSLFSLTTDKYDICMAIPALHRIVDLISC